jgi:hypothetical protein
MAEKCSWGDIPSSSGSGGDLAGFLKLQSGKNYKVRPLFDPVKFFKYFHKVGGKLKTAIVSSDMIGPLKDKYPDLKKPALRFAAYVIDREDGKVKILESGQSVFRPMGSHFEITGKNPGSGQYGSDWYIKVTGQGLNTEYDVGLLDYTPLSEEERKLATKALDGDKDKLKKLYKFDTYEEVHEKLFGDGQSDKDSSSDYNENESENNKGSKSDAFDENFDF